MEEKTHFKQLVVVVVIGVLRHSKLQAFHYAFVLFDQSYFSVHSWRHHCIYRQRSHACTRTSSAF